MATILRVYSPSMQPLGDLPDVISPTQQVVFNDVGTLTAAYPRSGVNNELLDLPAAYLTVVVDGVERPEVYLYEEDTDQDDANPVRSISVSARSYAAILETAVVFPGGWVTGMDPNGMTPTSKFTKRTPGLTMRVLLENAQDRGCFPGLGWSFTDTHDSAGVPWPQQFTITYPAGQNYLDVLRSMVESEWVDFDTNGNVLRMYVQDTALTADAPHVTYRLGKDCQLSTRSRSRRGLANAVLGVGEEKNMLYAEDATSITAFGRRETVASDGRMVTDGSLPQLVAATLNSSNRNKEGFSITVPLGERGEDGEKLWQPGVDFTVGNRIRYDQKRDSETALTPLQVKAISYTWPGETAPGHAVIEFNDLFVKWKVRQSRAIRAITLGNSTGAASTGLPANTTTFPDTTVPLPPTAVTLDASMVYEEDEKYRAQAAYSWTPPPENTDGSNYTDHDYYLFQWQVDGGEWSQVYQSVDPQAVVQDLRPGASVVLRVKAVDTASPPHASVWATSAATVMPIDNDPPPQPSAPTLTSRLGVVTVHYDGLDNVGAPMPADYARAVIHADATDPAFTPSGATVVGYILAGSGHTVVANLPYGTHHFRLVAIDTGDNASPASDAATIEVKSLVNTDVIGKVLDGAKLIDLSVDGATSLKAGSVVTSRLDVGALGENKQPNPLMEEADPATPTRPAGWAVMWWTGTGGTLSFQTASPIQGTRSLRIDHGADTDRTEVSVPTAIIPVNEGEQYRLKATFRASRAVAGRKAKLKVWASQTKDANGSIFNSPASIVASVAEADLTSANTTIEGVYTVPAGYKWLRMALDHDSPSDGGGAHAIVWDEVVFQRRIVSAVIADEAITAPKIAALAVEAGKLAANSVQTDNLDAGAVNAEKIALGTFGTNLVYDPSFEQDHTIESATAPTAQLNRWRSADPVGAGYVERALRPHSGLKALRMVAPASGDGVRVVSGVFPVTPGKTYNVAFHVAKERNEGDTADFYCRMAGGSTEALTEYPAAPYLPWIAFSGADPNFAEAIDPGWIGNNLYPYDPTIDSNADGIMDGGLAYSSGTVTAGARSVSAAGQALTASSIPDGARWGVQVGEVIVGGAGAHRASLDYTGLSGTNAQVKLYVDGWDSFAGVFTTNLGSVIGSAASGRLTLDLPVTANVDTYRIYAWLEPAAGTTASTAAATIGSIQLEAVDENGLTKPAQEVYQPLSGEFVAPAGINFCAVRFSLVGTTAAQSFFLDDVSVIEKGLGGTELTSAGLRLFGADGTEVGAFVSNRANYFTVTKSGNTLASISDDGGGAFQTLEVRGTDSAGDGVIDSGFRVYGTEFMDYINSLPRGLPAWAQYSGSAFNAVASGGQNGLFELGYDILPGRMYEFNMSPLLVTCSSVAAAGAIIGIALRCTTDGSTPTLSSPVISYSYHAVPYATNVAVGMHSRLLAGADTGQVYARFLPVLIASGCTATPYTSQGGGTTATIKDLGPATEPTGILRNLTSGTPASAPKKSYTTTWTSTNACCYMANGSKDNSQGSSDMKQGYSSYDGDSRSLWTFPSMTSTLSGATISKIEVYLYANHWYYNSGGTAKIKVHGNSSIPATLGGSSPMTTAVSSSSWPKPGGRWVTLPSSLHAGFISGAYKGIGVGPAGTSNLTYYGRFNKSGAKIRVTYVK